MSGRTVPYEGKPESIIVNGRGRGGTSARQKRELSESAGGSEKLLVPFVRRSVKKSGAGRTRGKRKNKRLGGTVKEKE